MSEKALTPEQFQDLAVANPDACRDFVSRAVAQRINAIRGIPGVTADFVIEQALRGHDVIQAKAELADAFIVGASPAAVAEASRAAGETTDTKKKR